MKKILVIEDESQINEVINIVLSFNGYETYTADNGEDGYTLAADIKPDLILSDIAMPGLNGFELLEKLQANPATASIPFLFLSAKTTREDIRAGMLAGADDYITKPFDIDELLAAIERKLKKHEAIEQQINKQIEDLRSSIGLSMPHEFRTPLNIILGFSDYLMKCSDSTPEDEKMEMVTHINEAAKQLNLVLEEYIYYTNLEIFGGHLKQNLVDNNFIPCIPKPVITDELTNIARAYDRVNDLFIDVDTCVIRIPEEYFTKLTKEIADNSFKFSEKDTPVRISGKISGKYFNLSFRDCGRGMTAEQISNLGAYIQFDRALYEQPGSGLGLAIVVKLAAIYDCKFHIESTPNEFTNVTISIPISDKI